MFIQVADLLVYQWGGLSPDSPWGKMTHFFVHDTLKIFVLLASMIFLIGVVRTWLPEERLRHAMRHGGLFGNFLAALFGALTPFCSCSSIPLFIGMLKAGVPLGAAFSFLITSPIINEYLAVVMAATFGLRITIAYIACGLLLGTIAGAVLGKMRLENYLEQALIASAADAKTCTSFTLLNRLRHGWEEMVNVLRQIGGWVVVAVALGALIHNYVPEEMVHSFLQATGVFSVPLATLLGVPMYGSCAAIVPIAVALFEKGIPLGTALAFMMAMAALSLPEAILLRRVLRLPLLALFFGLTAFAIMLSGYLLNALQPLL